MTSTSFIRVGGLKKCMPTTRSGCFSPAAIAVTDSDDVLVARMQRGPTIASRSRSSPRLTSRSSTIASMTRPHSASSGSVAARMRAGISVACSAGTLPFAASAFSVAAALRDGALDRTRLRIDQQHPMARLGGHLGDARAHGAGTDDSNHHLRTEGLIAHGRPHCPRKRGARFSMNAATPSRKSSEAPSSRW